MKSSLHHKVIYVAPFNLAVKDGTSIRVLNIARGQSQNFLMKSLFYLYSGAWFIPN